MDIVEIINTNHSEIKVRANWCSSFFSKFKGLMLVKDLPDFTGIILVDNTESRVNSGIHMLFMNFDITAVWIDASHTVVGVQLAKKWHLSYIPQKKAQYVLELSANHILDFQPGDHLDFTHEK